MVIELAGGANERLADYTRLTDMALRRRLETQRGPHMAKSFEVIIHTVATRHAPRSFLMVPRHLGEIRPVITSAVGYGGNDDDGEVPMFVAPEGALESVTGLHPRCGALTTMNRPELAEVPELLSSARRGAGAERVAVLEDLVDHANVGAAFRSTAALEIDAVLVAPHCAGPLYRRSVHVSMDTVFQVPWTRIGRRPAMDELHTQGFTVTALVLPDTSVILDEFAASPTCTAPDSRVTVVLGTEGDGLSHRTITATDGVVRIPMAGGVGSLDVTAATTVALWALHLP